MQEPTAGNSEPLLSLEAQYYTDPLIFEKEKRGVLAHTWQFACHASEIKHPGDYSVFDIAGDSLFCVRTKQHDIKAYYNVCQHRAHQLVQAQGSTMQFVCPYHAWTYELTGELRAGPNTHVVEGFKRESICLTEVRVEIFCGFVFANLDPNSKPMDELFPGVKNELTAFVPDIESLIRYDTVEVSEKCNWKVSIENYSECYHCQLNHPTFATGIVKPGTYDIQAQGYCLRHTTECQHLDKMTYPIDLTSNQHAGDYSSWFLWPLFSFQVYPGNVLNTYQWRAIDCGNVVVTRAWYAQDDSDKNVLKQLAIQDRETTVEEDIHLVESVQRGLHSRGYRPGPLVLDPECGVASEHSIKVLQQWMREGIDEN